MSGAPRTDGLTGRFPILDVWPTVECGQRPAAGVVGEQIPVRARVFREGHDSIGVELRLTGPDGTVHPPIAMSPADPHSDFWLASMIPDAMGHWSFEILAWDSPWATWVKRATVKIPAGIDVDLELTEGAALLTAHASTLPKEQGAPLRTAVTTMNTAALPPAVRLAAALDPTVSRVLALHPIRGAESVSGPWPLLVQRRRALVGSWYEFFPRSEGADNGNSGTFRTAANRLGDIAAMGFDVVYLPPIHPIGRTHRKGPNNTLTASPTDPGSPWAIGSAEGGHDAIHPDLGSVKDFQVFLKTAADHGLEIALDLALQASPDHPWVTAHPEWFTTRADGTIAYAENPPKKYQDIYPLNFDNDPEGLYAEIERIVRYWVNLGVRIFRVDNPHTKPLWLWDRLIRAINDTDPDVLFLAEAFTRPPMMRALAEVGFQQSYTYFTWRTGKHELEEYLTELAGPASAYMRPNFFANTPDILHEFLQYGGPAAFAIRAVLAATLSPTYGIYSGYELYEHVALRPGSEEYLDSEKFQLRPRDWQRARVQGRTLEPFLKLLNKIRREQPALQDLRSLRFHPTSDDSVIAYSKRVGSNVIAVVCLLDPHHEHSAMVYWDTTSWGIDPSEAFIARDHVTNTSWTWHRETYVRLNPWENVAHISEILIPHQGTE